MSRKCWRESSGHVLTVSGKAALARELDMCCSHPYGASRISLAQTHLSLTRFWAQQVCWHRGVCATQLGKVAGISRELPDQWEHSTLGNRCLRMPSQCSEKYLCMWGTGVGSLTLSLPRADVFRNRSKKIRTSRL